MEKQTKEQKKEEEKRVLAEFEEALRQEREQKEKDCDPSADCAEATEKGGDKKRTGEFHSAPQPETLHCRRCRTVMENGVCPVCGFKIYVPMSEEKSKRIRKIATGIGLVIFAILFIVLQATKG